MTETPSGWGTDTLSSFIENCRHNIFASFGNLRNGFWQLERIDKAYYELIGNLINTPDWRAAWFLLGTHSAFLGGARLSLSGQTTEAFRVLRGCIENALYGLHIPQSPDDFETWLRRHDSAQSLQDVKSIFRITLLFQELEAINPILHREAKELYDRTIDFGAHPNEKAYSSNMKILEGTETVKMELKYLTADPTQLRHCIRTNAQVGVCSLDIFKIVFRHRFDISGLSDTLEKLKIGL